MYQEGEHSLAWIGIRATIHFVKGESNRVSHMQQEPSYPYAFQVCFQQSFSNGFHQVFSMAEVGTEVPFLLDPARLRDEEDTHP